MKWKRVRICVGEAIIVAFAVFDRRVENRVSGVQGLTASGVVVIGIQNSEVQLLTE
jgi:hypothetical protein